MVTLWFIFLIRFYHDLFPHVTARDFFYFFFFYNNQY